MSSRSTILALAAGLAMLLGPHAEAQQPPPSAVLKIASTPDEATRNSIQAFIDPQMKLIATGNPEQVQEARKTLASLLRKPDCSLVFFRTFLQLATPEIGAIVKSGDAFRATNALLVVRQIRCSEALSMVLDQASASTQSDARVRVAASAMIGAMVRGGAVQPTELDGVARRTRENVELETNPYAASQLIESLGAIASTADAAKLPNTVRGTFDELVKATTAALARAQKPDSADFAMVVFRGLFVMRETVLKMTPDQQKALGKTVEPLLRQVDTLSDDPKGSDTQWVVSEIRAAKAALPGLAKLVGLEWKKPEPAKK
jgi:hypothetical protein